MRNMCTILAVSLFLSACGSAPVSKEQQRDVKEGKKAILETNNRQLSDYLYIVPIFTDAYLGGQPNQINILSIDGKKLDREWKRVNDAVVIEPGEHAIEVSCAVEITDMNRDVNDRSDTDIQWSTDIIRYTFEGGKNYQLYAKEYINGTCTTHIRESN